jgi:hypothetical protein
MVPNLNLINLIQMMIKLLILINIINLIQSNLLSHLQIQMISMDKNIHHIPIIHKITISNTTNHPSNLIKIYQSKTLPSKNISKFKIINNNDLLYNFCIYIYKL